MIVEFPFPPNFAQQPSVYISIIFGTGDVTSMGAPYDGAAVDFVQIYTPNEAVSALCPIDISPAADAFVSPRDFNSQGKVGVKFSWTLPPLLFDLSSTTSTMGKIYERSLDLIVQDTE